MQRPSGVNFTAGLMALNILVDLVHSLLSISHGLPALGDTAHRTTATIILHVAMFGYEAVQIVGVVFYWLGRPWARWLVVVGCLLYIVSLKDLRILWGHTHFSAYLTIAGAALACYLLWYLHTLRVREWFARDMILAAKPIPAKAL